MCVQHPTQPMHPRPPREFHMWMARRAIDPLISGLLQRGWQAWAGRRSWCPRPCELDTRPRHPSSKQAAMDQGSEDSARGGIVVVGHIITSRLLGNQVVPRTQRKHDIPLPCAFDVLIRLRAMDPSNAMMFVVVVIGAMSSASFMTPTLTEYIRKYAITCSRCIW